MAVDGFEKVSVWKLQDDERLSQRPDSAGISVRYQVRNEQALNNYLEYHAEKLRQDGIDRFSGRFIACPRVLSGLVLN